MGALAANTATIQILQDTTEKVVAKLFMHADTAFNESSVLKINASALAFQTMQFRLAQLIDLKPGELITGNTSGATGYIAELNQGSNSITVTSITGTFSNTEYIIGALSGQSANINLVTTPTRELDIESVEWTVSDGSAKVGLEFANSSAFDTAFTCSSMGYYGRSLGGVLVKPVSTLTSPNGNLYVSTYSVPAKGGYSIIVTMRKTLGYARIPSY